MARIADLSWRPALLATCLAGQSLRTTKPSHTGFSLEPGFVIALKGKGIATEPFSTGFEYTTVLAITLLRLKGLRKPQRNDEEREEWKHYSSRVK